MNRFDNRPRVNRLPPNPEPNGRGRFPSWLHRKLPKGGTLWTTAQALGGLHTVCEEARCPNLLECWSRKTATFLVMGKQCTRACGFCDIDTNPSPPPLDPDEPARVAKSVETLGLKHTVITMVARDDLPDGGAGHLAEIIRQIPTGTVEVLTSDFDGNWDALDTVLAEQPTVFNHNIETVRELTPRVRHRATYDRSLQLLHRAHAKHVKSGLMVGLGETEAQVQQAIDDLKEAGVNIVTIGQYLQPSHKKLAVKAFIHPDQFDAYRAYGESLGLQMHCGPFVRSSYNAGALL